MNNWKKLPLWFRAGTLTAIGIIILEALYMTAVLLKVPFVLWVFPLHVLVLFPVMLVLSIFTSPSFLVSELIPPTGGLFLVLLFWFAIGAVIGLIINALKPHYEPPVKPYKLKKHK